jgi:flavin-dependent dehydrogenase
VTDVAFDVAVVGAGPAGAACALRLASRGLSVLLFNGGRRRGWREGEVLGPEAAELLVREVGCAIPPASLAIEARQSRWEASTPLGFETRVWSAAPAWVVDREALDRALCDAASAAGAHRINSAVTAVSRTAKGWLLSDGEQHVVSARFLVEATGRVSRSLACPDTARLFVDRLICQSAVVPRDSSHFPMMGIAATAWGWCYTVPLRGSRTFLSWFTDADLRNSPGAASLGTCLEAFGYPATTGVSAGRPGTVCARSSIRTRLWRGPWLAIGDAAWCLDPLSGDGISRAVSDGLAAADAIAASLQSGADEVLRQHALGRAAAFKSALLSRLRVYAAVPDWQDEPFWRRRKGASLVRSNPWP